MVITCHNYGQFLADAIKSVLDQSVRPQQILVIDDSSTDDTALVAARFEPAGVEIRRVEYRSVYRARHAGMQATESEILCFLDADDLLPEDYLERGLPLFGSNEVGLVYSDIELFWERSGREIQPEFDPIEFDRDNFMHAGTLVRRRALEIADAFRGPDVVDGHEDWLVWRRVIDAGWTGVKQSGVYWYRKHWKQLPSRSDQLGGDYFALGSLRLMDVTIFTALSGASSSGPGTRTGCLRRAGPAQTRLFLLDTSGDAEFGRAVRLFLADAPYPDTRYASQVVGEAGLADKPRDDYCDAVRLVCARIYNRMVREIVTPFVLVLEDDIIPPPGVIDRLLRAMDQRTGAVGVPYRSRLHGDYVAWNDEGDHLHGGEGVEAIGGCGFGCLLLRRSVLLGETLSYGFGEPPDFDPAFCRRLRRNGWTIKIDWSQECRHLNNE